MSFTLRTGTFVLLSAVPTIFAGGAYAKTDSCGSAKVLSGTGCSDLTVEFDVSKCEGGGSAERLVGKSECSGERARATVFSKRFRFRAEFKKAGGEWDAAKWEQAGSVRRKYLELEHKADQARKPAAEGAVQPAQPPSAPPKELANEPATPSTGTAVVNPAVAQTSPEAAAQDAKSKPAPLAISGLVDVFYGFNFNQPKPVAARGITSVADQNIPQGNTYYRFYDNFHNDFGVNLLELSIRKSDGEVNFAADLDFGNIADYNAFSYPAADNRTQTVIDEVSKHIGQAVISYTPAGFNRLTLEVGKLITHVGYETYKARDDWQYSRSTLASYGLPFWHVGGHASFAVVPDKLVVGAYIYNGWNTIYETNSSKTFGFQAKWTPSADLTAVFNTIMGPENANNDTAWRYLNEANFTWVASPSVSFALETLVAWENQFVSADQAAYWGGSTFHMKWNISERAYLSPRFEFYRDIGGLSLINPGITQSILGVTLTHGYQLARGLDTRLEARWDFAQGASPYQASDGMKDSQATLTAAILYSF